MRKKLTAALTALVFLVTSVAMNPVTYARSATTKDEVKSFTKAENQNGIKKSTIEKNIAGKAYGPEDEVTIIVELEDIPLLEHYKMEQTNSFARSVRTESFDEYAVSPNAEQITDKLLTEQKNVAKQIQGLKTEKRTADVIYNYTAVMNGFAVKVKYKTLEEIRKLPRVKAAYAAGSYEKIRPVMDTSTDTIGAVPTWDLNIRGEGTIVAILDTGLDTGHVGFQKVPSDPKFTESDIQQKITAGPGLKSRITDAAQTYVSAKIPYAFDYADFDKEVTPSVESVEQNGNDHGTHVAGTIAAPDNDGDSITGVAPEAQLMILKVFSDTIGLTGAYTEDILAALDDAVTLGADVINMSLGSPSGFTQDGETSVTNVYDRIAEAGITMAVSAGNSYSSSYMNGLNGLNGMEGAAFSGNPDTSVVGSPSTYAASTSVASVINANYHASYFEVNGEKITYTETAAGRQPLFSDLKTVSGAALEYVPVPNTGDVPDYEEIDVNGRIALVQRGTLSFQQKLLNAVSGGAIGLIVYNNTEGTIAMALPDDYSIPAVSITMADGDKLLKAENKTLTISDEIGIYPDENAGRLSDFSSWGVTPDLKLKPEIAAPGENIYSTLPFDRYGSMSGTSMAAPHIAGSFALVKEYLNSSAKFSTEYEKSELANDLLMSTAIPAKNSDGVYYSPRKQGSGIVNVYNAVNTDAYLYVTDENEANRRPKLNLGDDVLKAGVFQKSFQIRSVTGSAISFVPQAAVLTEALAGDGVIGETPSDISGLTNVEFSVDGAAADVITVQPREDITVTVTIQLTDDLREYLNESFENGEFIDGFIILESVETSYDLTIPFMGFYGDWTQAPLFDSGSADDLQGYQQTVHALLTDDGSSYLGVNPFDEYAYALIGNVNPYLHPELYEFYQPMADPDKIAISPNGDYSFEGLDIAYISQLRNSRDLDWSITDKNNHILASDSYDYQTKSIYDQNYALVVPTVLDNIYWDGTDAEGKSLENNTEVTFKVEGQLDYTGHGQNNMRNTLTFPVTIDVEEPTLEEVSEESGNILQIKVRDNQYVSAVFLLEKTDLTTPVASCLLDEDSKGTTTAIDIDLKDLGLSGDTAADLAVIIFDYATNAGIYYLDQGASPSPTDPATPTPTGSEPSPTPTESEPSPTPAEPTITPTPAAPTVTPTVPVTPTTTPTGTPTHRPDPTSAPTQSPTGAPTASLTPAPTAAPTPQPVESAEVTPSVKTLFVGETGKITVKLPAGLTDKDTAAITYSSGDKTVATVSSAGTITAIKAGSAVITTKITINGSSVAFTTKVTVKDPYISFVQKTAAVYTGSSFDFNVKLYGIKAKITYSVSDTRLASINKKTGVLTAKKTGTVYVTAKAGSFTEKLKVTLKQPYIGFTQKQSSLKVGKSFDFNVKLYGIKAKINYSVSDTRLASINKKTGIFTAKKTGTVYVTAKAGTYMKRFKVAIVK